MKPYYKEIQSVNLEKESLFSYVTTRYTEVIVLKQRETGFSLLIEMDASEGILRLQKFSLCYKKQLEEVSVALHDAAVVEIVLEGLESLFTYAREHNIYEIFCLLPEEEAKRLTLFGSLFINYSALLTKEGKRASFTLFSYPEAQNIVRRKVELIKSEIIKELKTAQHTDSYLKTYLRRHKKNKMLSRCDKADRSLQSIQENSISSFGV